MTTTRMNDTITQVRSECRTGARGEQLLSTAGDDLLTRRARLVSRSPDQIRGGLFNAQVHARRETSVRRLDTRETSVRRLLAKCALDTSSTLSSLRAPYTLFASLALLPSPSPCLTVTRILASLTGTLYSASASLTGSLYSTQPPLLALSTQLVEAIEQEEERESV